MFRSKLLALAALICLTAPSFAQEEILGGGVFRPSAGAPVAQLTTPLFSTWTPPTSGTSNYYGAVQTVANNTTFATTTLTTGGRVPIPIAGTFSKLSASLGYNQVAGPTIEDTINGSVGNLTCAYAASSVSSCTDATHSDHLSAGDVFNWGNLSNGTAWSNSPAVFAHISSIFKSDNSQESFILNSPINFNISSTTYLPIGSASSGTHAGVAQIMPIAGTISGIFAFPNGTDNSSGVTHTYGICVNGACASSPSLTGVACANSTPTVNPTAGCCATVSLTPQHIGGSGGPLCTTGITGTHVSVGDSVAIVMWCPSTCGFIQPGVGLVWVPDTTNQVPIFAQLNSGISSTHFIGVSDFTGPTTTAQTTYQNVPAAMTFSNLLVCSASLPSATGTWTDAVQVGATLSTLPTTPGGGPTGTISHSSSACPGMNILGLSGSVRDTTHTLSVAAGNTVDHTIFLTGTSSGSGIVRSGMAVTVP